MPNQNAPENRPPVRSYARRESYLAAAVEVQRMLLAAESKDLPIDPILSILGAVFHVSRVYLVENRYDLDERVYMQRQFEWCAAGVSPLKHDPAMQKVYYDSVLPHWRSQLSQGEIIAGILTDFPLEEQLFLTHQRVQSILIFPLLVNGSFSGFLAFDDCLEARQWQPAEISLLQVVTTSIAMVRERAETEDHLTSAYRELAQRLVELSTLNEIIQTVATVKDLRQVLELIATKLSLLFDAVNCSIALLSTEQDALREIVQYRRDKDRVSVIGERILLEGNAAIQQVIENSQPLIIADAQHNPIVAVDHELLQAQGITCILIIPLLSRGQVLGTIRLSLDTPGRTFSLSEVRLAETIAGQVAGAIENARLFQEVEQARTAAVSSNQAKSAFLASMSHELRTPLNAILGFTQLMLRNPDLSADQRESLETITRSGDHLLGLINDVLDLSKIEAGRVTVQESEFDLHYLLRGLEEMFALRIKAKGLLFRFEHAPDTPRHIHSDESKLRQILINLLGNAIKFTTRGSITLSVRTEEIPSRDVQLLEASPSTPTVPNIRLIFEITDTGIGVPHEDLERIFEPFMQSRQGPRAAEGTGLGLAISREYAHLLGGDLTVHSRQGFGSTFRLKVVVGKAATGSLPISQSPSRVIGLMSGQQALRVLVAEDNEPNRQLLVLLLTSIGFQVQGVENGAEAVQITRDWKPHIVWMDIRMPILDGLEATRQIKAMGPEAPVVIALTASVLEDKRSISLEAGCDDYLSKPYREAEIFDILERHLGVRFLYEGAQEVSALEEQPADLGEPITGSSLQSLTTETLNRLGQAALGGDIISLERAIQEIHTLDKSLARALDQLANQFEYSKIHALTQEALQGRS